MKNDWIYTKHSILSPNDFRVVFRYLRFRKDCDETFMCERFNLITTEWYPWGLSDAPYGEVITEEELFLELL